MTSDTIFREYRISDAERSDRSAGDRLRHREKVRESIRENIADIIAEESIIGKNSDRVIKVPLRGIKEYRFVYGDNAPGRRPGRRQRAARAGRRQDRQGRPGPGRRQGRRSARRRLLRDRRHARGADRDHVRGSRTARPRTARAARDSKPTASPSARAIATSASACGSTSGARRAQRVKRMLGDAAAIDDRRAGRSRPPKDARRQPSAASRSIRTTCATSISRPMSREESNAVVICIMDTSGSMDTMKKYLARSFFFLLYQFISTRYRNVEIVFIAHHTEANEVTEDEFFHKGESGRHVHLVGLSEGAGHHRRALPSVALEHLRVPLLGRRQLRFRQSGGAEGRARAGRDLQPLRLRRDQAARLALLRILDAERFPPARRPQLPDRADRAQGRHLAIVQGVPRQGSVKE